MPENWDKYITKDDNNWDQYVVDKKEYQGVQPQNILGKIFNVPGAAIRSAIQGKGYAQGALQPDSVPRFQNLAINAVQKSTNPLINAAVGMPASALGLAADIVTNPADMLGMIAGKTPIGNGRNVEQAISATPLARNINKAINPSVEQQINSNIDKSIQKAIRPSVVGKQNSTQVEKYTLNARDAVKSIIENKQNLQFVDESGQVVNKLPESLNEFSQAITQTKKSIFNKYNDLTKQGEGLSIDTTPVSKTLQEIANSKVLKIKNPQIADYATELNERISNTKLSPSEAQDLIESFNSDLKAFYKNPDYNSASKATVDAAVANNLRKSLDSTISGLTGKQYQSLKNQYGSLSAIEKDVNKRFIVDARKNVKGLLDFTDIFSAGDIIKGVTTMDPASISKGIFQTAVKGVFKKMNDPNHIIKGMFNKVDKIYTPRPTVVTPEVLRNRQPIINKQLPNPVKRLPKS